MATRRTPRQPTRPTKAESLALRLHAAASRIVRSARASGRAQPLSPARLSALHTLVTSSPVTLRLLADLEHVRPPTMTRIVQALERLGMVKRMKGGRRVFVIATGKGRETLVRAQRALVERLAITIRCLRPTKLALLTKAVRFLEVLVESSGG